MAIARRGLPQGKARARRDFRRSADAKRVPHRLVAMSKQDLRAAARSPRSLSGLLPFIRPYRGLVALMTAVVSRQIDRLGFPARLIARARLKLRGG